MHTHKNKNNKKIAGMVLTILYVLQLEPVESGDKRVTWCSGGGQPAHIRCSLMDDDPDDDGLPDTM